MQGGTDASLGAGMRRRAVCNRSGVFEPTGVKRLKLSRLESGRSVLSIKRPIPAELCFSRKTAEVVIKIRIHWG